MSLEENIVKLIGITFILYWCARVLIGSTIKAYKEIRIDLHQSVIELQKQTLDDKIEYELEQIKRG